MTPSKQFQDISCFSAIFIRFSELLTIFPPPTISLREISPGAQTGKGYVSLNWDFFSLRFPDFPRWNSAWLVVLTYLLISPGFANPLFQSTMTSTRGHRGHLKGHRVAKPKWVNPCGLNPSAMKQLAFNFGSKHYEVTPLSNGELLENVILAAKNALRHSNYFKEDYVSRFLFGGKIQTV